MAQALAHFEEAVSADSLYSEAYLHWGIALERLERWEAAIGKLERAAELEIDKGPVLF